MDKQMLCCYKEATENDGSFLLLLFVSSHNWMCECDNRPTVQLSSLKACANVNSFKVTHTANKSSISISKM